MGGRWVREGRKGLVKEGWKKREGLEKAEPQAKNMHQYFVDAKTCHLKRPLYYSAHIKVPFFT